MVLSWHECYADLVGVQLCFEGIDDLNQEHYLGDIFLVLRPWLIRQSFVIDSVAVYKLLQKIKEIEPLIFSDIDDFVTGIKIHDLGREVINKSKACPR